MEDPHTYDFGVGAGFYLNATTDKYKTHYNMQLRVQTSWPILYQTQRVNIVCLGGIDGPLDTGQQRIAALACAAGKKALQVRCHAVNVQ